MISSLSYIIGYLAQGGSTMNTHTLPQFQKFLISRKFIDDKYVPYFAYWASQFLAYSKNNGKLSADLLIQGFLEKLQESKSDWQVRQADRAIQIYLYHFCDKPTLAALGGSPKTSIRHLHPEDIVKKMREMLRLKHYSYKTERTYVNWVKNFFIYVNQHPSELPTPEKLNSKEVKNYLAYLAIKRRVSASTQNQAFNALLFLFRNILHIELTDMSTTLRAKRGQKLPVVLSVDEVQKLFQHLKGKNLLMLQLLYGAGLRITELLRLRIKDIDFDTNLIFVRSSKGDKDRSTILPEKLIQSLQEQCALCNVHWFVKSIITI